MIVATSVFRPIRSASSSIVSIVISVEVYVHHQQPEIGEPAVFGHERAVEPRLLAQRRDAVGRFRVAQAERFAGDTLDPARAGKFGDLLEVRRRDVAALDDEMHVVISGKRRRDYSGSG